MMKKAQILAVAYLKFVAVNWSAQRKRVTTVGEVLRQLRDSLNPRTQTGVWKSPRGNTYDRELRIANYGSSPADKDQAHRLRRAPPVSSDREARNCTRGPRPDPRTQWVLYARRLLQALLSFLLLLLLLLFLHLALKARLPRLCKLRGRNLSG